MVNTAKLQGLMRERNQTISSLSNLTNLSKTGLFNKIHGKVEFVCSEMQIIKQALHLTEEEFVQVFFSQNVELNSTK